MLADSATVTIRTSDGATVAAVHGGFLSVAKDNVSILAETAELAAEIDAERAKLALERLTRTSGEAGAGSVELAQQRAETRLVAAQAHLQAH